MKTKIFGKIKFPSLGGVRGGFFLPLLGRGLGGGFLLLWGLGGGGVLLAQTPDLPVCADKGYTIKTNKEAAGSNVTYKWYEKANDGEFGVVESETSSSFKVAAKNAAGTYAYVRMAFSEDCEGGVASNTFTVVVLKPDVPTVSVTTLAVCQNVGDLEFTVTPADNTTYTWSWLGTEGTPTGDDNSTYTIGSSATGTKEVQAKASVFYEIGDKNKTCTSALSQVAQATVNPLPTIATVGSTAFCGTTSSHQLEVEAEVGESAVGVAVAWYDNNAGTGEALSNVTTYTPASLTTTATTYYVKATVIATSCVNPILHQVSASLSLDEGTIGGEED